jgi:dsDNA-binding SOS-regulon protein
MSDDLMRVAEDLADELEEVLRVSPCGTEEEEERLTMLLAAFRREQIYQVCRRAVAKLSSPRAGRV